MLDCFNNFYRPDNLSIIIAGKLEDKESVLNTIASYEHDYCANVRITIKLSKLFNA